MLCVVFSMSHKKEKKQVNKKQVVLIINMDEDIYLSSINNFLIKCVLFGFGIRQIC